MLILHIILKPDDKHPEAEFFEVYPPWADPEQRTIFDKFKEDAFAAAIGKAYADATGRNVETHWEDDEAPDIEPENDYWHDPHRNEYDYSLII